mmetsp:Transcript_44162/g.114809  ORF Transcript_44162/g.114809 Transcript_44162/m.114809 type:complete len:248 (-) Transcript_44162:513-1256(-)
MLLVCIVLIFALLAYPHYAFLCLAQNEVEIVVLALSISHLRRLFEPPLCFCLVHIYPHPISHTYSIVDHTCYTPQLGRFLVHQTRTIHAFHHSHPFRIHVAEVVRGAGVAQISRKLEVLARLPVVHLYLLVADVVLEGFAEDVIRIQPTPTRTSTRRGGRRTYTSISTSTCMQCEVAADSSGHSTHHSSSTLHFTPLTPTLVFTTKHIISIRTLASTTRHGRECGPLHLVCFAQHGIVMTAKLGRAH